MKQDTAYTVRVTELPTERTFELDARFVREALQGMTLRDALDRPEDDAEAGAATAEVELHADDANVFVRGSFRGHFEIACSRCLSVVRVGVDEPLAVTYMPAASMPADVDPSEEDEVEVAADDLDVYPYDGERVDLEPLFREQLVLAMPFAAVCSDACAGLCPKCGTNLNDSACECDRAVIDPRLAALKDFKV